MYVFGKSARNEFDLIDSFETAQNVYKTQLFNFHIRFNLTQNLASISLW